jgi:hypothetical protein
MSTEIRPEFLDSDDDQWFFRSGEVPQMTCSGHTTAELFVYVGILGSGWTQEELDNAGYADPKPARDKAERLLVGSILGPHMRQVIGEFLVIAEWAIKHERRIEWC